MKTISKQALVVNEHLGIIAKLALHYWRSLPMSAMASYDPEDMIADVVLHVVACAQRYHPKRAGCSTFVWHVANNYCQVILARYRTKKRTGVLVQLDKAVFISRADHMLMVANSCHVIEHIIEDSSDDLRTVLSLLFTHTLRWPSRRVTPAVIEELRNLVRKHGATYQDFSIVLSWV